MSIKRLPTLPTIPEEKEEEKECVPSLQKLIFTKYGIRLTLAELHAEIQAYPGSPLSFLSYIAKKYENQRSSPFLEEPRRGGSDLLAISSSASARSMKYLYSKRKTPMVSLL